MEFLRELLQDVTEASKKPKVSRTVAAGVYHRDYIRTKKKPYRKYHPSEENEEEVQDDIPPTE